jgi:hypothetical protein
MPERVVLTPLPDQDLLHLAKNVVDGMDIQQNIEVKHTMKTGSSMHESMSPHDFATHFCLRFLGRLWAWRKFTSFEGVPSYEVRRENV